MDVISNTEIATSKGEENTFRCKWMKQQTNIWQKYNAFIPLPNSCTWQATGQQDMGDQQGNNETWSLATELSHLTEVAMYTNNSGA